MTTPGGAFGSRFSYIDRVVIPDEGAEVPAIAGLVEALATKADVNHTQAIDTITNLEASLAALTAAVTALQGGELGDLPEFADNAAAIAGALAVGSFYRDTDGIVRQVFETGTSGGYVPTPPPAGTQLISQWNPTTSFNYYSPYFDAADPSVPFWYKNAKRVSDLSFQPWCLSSPDDNILRFEVRSGDQFNVPGFYADSAGVNRNKITEVGADWHSPTEDLRYDFQVKIEGPTITSNFFALLEVHTYGSGVIAQKFELIIRNEKFAVTANADVVTNGTPAYRTLWTDTQNIVRGKWYPVTIFVRSNRSATPAGRVVVDLDGTRVVDFTGRTGYANETQCSVEFGIYRGTASPETIVVSYKDWVQASGPYGTLAIPTSPGGVTPPATTYGPDLFNGSGSFDTAVAPWTATDSAVLASVGGELSVTTAAGDFVGPPSARFQIDTLEVGATYRLQGTYRKGTGASGSAEVLAYNAAFTTTYVDVTNTTTTNADCDQTFVADNATAIIFLCRTGATANGNSAFFDNFTLRKVIT